MKFIALVLRAELDEAGKICHVEVEELPVIRWIARELAAVILDNDGQMKTSWMIERGFLRLVRYVAMSASREQKNRVVAQAMPELEAYVALYRHMVKGSRQIRPTP